MYSPKDLLQDKAVIALVNLIEQVKSSPEKFGKILPETVLKEVIIQAVKGYNKIVKKDQDRLTLFQGKVISQ